MTYPPEWAGKYPTVEPSYTYSNIYDLDELDVYYEEDSYRPIFFNIEGLPDRLSYGKHWFTISFNDSPDTDLFLKERSSILFEFKDSNGTVLYSDLTRYNSINGAAIAYVWIKPDPLRTWEPIAEGLGTLTIVGELGNVPKQWQDAYNVRLTLPVDIRKNLPNNGPILFQSASLMQAEFRFSEVIDTDIQNSIYERSYAQVSASYLHTYGGEVKFFDLSYRPSGSQTDDFKDLSLFPLSSSEYELSSQTGSDVRGLNPISAIHKIPMPEGFKQNEPIQFKLRFLNSNFESAQNPTDATDVEVTSSFIRFAGVPVFARKVMLYSGSATDHSGDIALEMEKGGNDELIVSSGSGAAKRNIVDIAARQDVKKDELGKGGVKIGLKGSAVGDFSTAVGFGSFAGGTGSIAVGQEASASGIGSTAAGSGSKASGGNSVAIGANSKSPGDGGIGIGYARDGTGATGAHTTAIGIYASASNTGATVIGGIENSATAQYAAAIGGYQNIASGNYSVALIKSKVSGKNSIGINLNASGNRFEVSKPGTFAVGVGNNTLMVISSSAVTKPRVGIGTDNPEWPLHVKGDSPAALFEGDVTISGSLTAQQYILSSSITYITTSYSDGSTIFGDTPADDTHQFTGSVSISGSSGLVINTGGFEVSSGNISGSGTSTGSFGALYTAGNIGVGTTEPSRSYGSDNFLAIEGSSNPALVINDTGQSSEYVLVADGTYLTLKTNSTAGNIMRWQGTTGKVGVGGAAPTKTLTVEGDISASGALMGVTHITASGNISGSSTSTGSFGRVESDTFNVTTFSPDTISTTHITASGDISASGDLYLGSGKKIDFSSGDVTMTHAANLLTIAGGKTRVDQLQIDSTTNYLDIVSSDLVLVAAADVSFKPDGGNVKPQSDNSTELGASDKRWKDVFATQTTIGAMFEVGLRTKDIGKLKTGTVMVWRNDKLVPCDSDLNPFVMGIVKEEKDEPIVIGAEPVLVTGKIDVGDFITTSKKIGHGKAIKSGYLLKKDLFGKVIAQSLESGNGSSYTIKCMIRKM